MRYSRNATAMATAFKNLNKALGTFLTRLFRTNERSKKSKWVFEKPSCYEDESDGCIENWIEVIELHLKEEDLTEKQECSRLTGNLEGAALNCVMAKKQYLRETDQREDETIDYFLDDLEMLRRRSQTDESNSRMNLAVASKFIDGVKNDELISRLEH